MQHQSANGWRIYYHHYKHKLKIFAAFFKKNGGTNKKLKSFFNEKIA
jgi:hypothetical protein